MLLHLILWIIIAVQAVRVVNMWRYENELFREAVQNVRDAWTPEALRACAKSELWWRSNSRILFVNGLVLAVLLSLAIGAAHVDVVAYLNTRP